MTSALRWLLLAALLAAFPSLAADYKLEHRSPSIAAGQDLEFVVRLPGPSPVLGNVYWRRKGDVNYQSLSMKQSGATLAAKLPEFKLHSDIEYYIEVYYGGQIDRKANIQDAEQPLLLTLPKAAPPQAIAKAGANADPRPPPQGNSLVPPIAVVGVAAAAGVVGLLFGLQAQSSAGDMNAARNPADYAVAKSAADGAATKSTVAWIGAGALAAVGAALLVWRF